MGKISLGTSIIYDDTSGSGGSSLFSNLPFPFASSEFSTSYKALAAFDLDAASYWSATGIIGQFIGIDYNGPVIVTKLYLHDVNNRLKDFVFEGSNEKLANYTVLLSATRSNVTTETAFDVANTVTYRYYRVRCTGTLYIGSNFTLTGMRMEYKTG